MRSGTPCDGDGPLGCCLWDFFALGFLPSASFAGLSYVALLVAELPCAGLVVKGSCGLVGVFWAFAGSVLAAGDRWGERSGAWGCAAGSGGWGVGGGLLACVSAVLQQCILRRYLGRAGSNVERGKPTGALGKADWLLEVVGVAMKVGSSEGRGWVA